MGSTIEFLAAWESLHNDHFNPVGSDRIKTLITGNSFRLSVNRWVEETNAFGIAAKAGRYGGTWAHRDIALQFCYWLSPVFQVYLVKEFQRLKSAEASVLNLDWSLRRELAKLNYPLHTEAVRNLIDRRRQLFPTPKSSEARVYAGEADVLNVAVFGMTATEWRAANPRSKGNIRDQATIEQLHVLANMESYNAILLRNGLDQWQRVNELTRTAAEQLKIFEEMNIAALSRLKRTDGLDA
ncbi:MAG: KilA-N domain-containing protein [Saprospiraceae bacterium]|nr:KilA-N domain-containing protein [Saprospiraceae bacterium]